MLSSELKKETDSLIALEAMKITDPKEYIEALLPTLGMYASATGELKDGKDSPLEVMQSRIHRAYMLDRKHLLPIIPKDLRPENYRKEVLMAALGEVLFDQRQKEISRIIEKVKFVSEDFTELKRFVKALNEDTNDLDVLSVAHYIWGVKRKMLGKKAHFPLVLHLHGPQRTGKSTAVEKLIEVLNPCVKRIDIQTVTDPRASANILNKHFMVFIDEIEWPDTASVNTLKRLISSEEEGYRIMRSNDSPNIKNNASFITAANYSIGEIVRDQTGMGRYFQINVPKPTNWKEISGPGAINFLKIYQGIDENLETGYWSKVQDYIRPLQEKMVAANSVATFIEEEGLRFTESDSVCEVSMNDLYARFDEFLKEGNYRPMDKSIFGAKLAGHQFSSRKTTYKGKAITLYTVNANTDLLKFGQVTPFKRKQEEKVLG